MGTPANPLDPINAAVDQLTTDLSTKFAALTTEIQGLKAQVAAGNPITQAQLDSLLAKVQAADASVNAFSA